MARDKGSLSCHCRNMWARINPRLGIICTVAGVLFATCASGRPYSRLPHLHHRYGPEHRCSILEGTSCIPYGTTCSVFRHRPCMPDIVYPLGQELVLTVSSRESEEQRQNTHVGEQLNTILQVFADLRACWTPPPEEDAKAGAQITVRMSFNRSGSLIAKPKVTYVSSNVPSNARQKYLNAITASLERCTPIRFSPALGGAIAGRPFAIRFVDDRDLRQEKN
jgi:hypothetical protein